MRPVIAQWKISYRTFFIYKTCILYRWLAITSVNDKTGRWHIYASLHTNKPTLVTIPAMHNDYHNLAINHIVSYSYRLPYMDTTANKECGIASSGELRNNDFPWADNIFSHEYTASAGTDSPSAIQWCSVQAAWFNRNHVRVMNRLLVYDFMLR